MTTRRLANRLESLQACVRRQNSFHPSRIAVVTGGDVTFRAAGYSRDTVYVCKQAGRTCRIERERERSRRKEGRKEWKKELHTVWK